MIDTLIEEVAPLEQAVAWVPRRRRGRTAHLSTLYRWSKAGCRGVRLETIQVGGSLCTSREALQRFFEALTTRSRGDTPADDAIRRATPLRSRPNPAPSAAQRAAEELARMGA